MYKICVVPLRTGEEEIVFAQDFERTENIFSIYKDNDSCLSYFTHALESVYIERSGQEETK